MPNKYSEDPQIRRYVGKVGDDVEGRVQLDDGTGHATAETDTDRHRHRTGHTITDTDRHRHGYGQRYGGMHRHRHTQQGWPMAVAAYVSMWPGLEAVACEHVFGSD